MAMLSAVLKLTGMQSQEERDNKLYDDLLHHEAEIGGKVFGKVPKNTHRRFFCLDEKTWVWHEEWTDANGKRQVRTTRYVIHDNHIFKTSDDKRFEKLNVDEAGRFYEAVKIYIRNVKRDIYQIS